MSQSDRLVVPGLRSKPQPLALDPATEVPWDEATQGRLFHAFREEPVRRRRWPYLVGALLLAVPIGWALNQRTEGATDIITRHGFKTVRPGMTEQQVFALLGRPLATDKDRGEGCYRYGMPSMETPSFVLYSVCFEEGKLRDVQQRRYATWDMTKPGEVQPPPEPLDRRRKAGTL
jgi:SmpA / OmlA family